MQAAPKRPEVPEDARHLQTELMIGRCIHAPLEGRSNVAQLGSDALERLCPRGTTGLLSKLFDQIGVPGELSVTQVGGLAARLQPLQAVLADRLQHRDAWLAST